MNRLNRETLTLALCIALFPPLWAVLAPFIGVQTGAVALICAGVYVAAGNDRRKALPMSLGFLAGDLWAVLALWIMETLSWNESLELFLTLCVMGGAAVLIASALPKLFFCPAWLCGWAIGLTVLAPIGLESIGSYPVQIAVAMLVGVWYVGVFLDAVHARLRGSGKESDEKKKETKLQS